MGRNGAIRLPARLRPEATRAAASIGVLRGPHFPGRGAERSANRAADAHCEAMLGEFILPYDAVRGAAEPDALLLDFLSTTYAAAAEAGGWDRAALECPIGVPGRVRRG